VSRKSIGNLVGWIYRHPDAEKNSANCWSIMNLLALCVAINEMVCRPTHWEQSVIYVSQPVAVRQGDAIAGSITIEPSPSYRRLISALHRDYFNYVSQNHRLLVNILVSRTTYRLFYYSFSLTAFGRRQ